MTSYARRLERGAIVPAEAELPPGNPRGRAARQARAARISALEAARPRLFDDARYDAGATDPQEPKP